VSDTPRTESFNCYDNGCDNPLHAWGAFSAELERELNAANERIKRMEEAGDEVEKKLGCGCGCYGLCKNCQSASENWRKARGEAKL